jgi:hypothetical protein
MLAQARHLSRRALQQCIQGSLLAVVAFVLDQLGVPSFPL